MRKFIIRLTAVCLTAALACVCLLASRREPFVLQADLPVEVTVEYPSVPSAPIDRNMTPREKNVFVQPSAVNIRSGPSADYPVIATVRRGEKLSVQGDFVNGWIKISGKTVCGYADGRYLSDSPAGDENAVISAPKDAALTEADGFGTAACSLNLRSGSSDSSKILAVLPEGAAVRILGKYADEWYAVMYSGVHGFVKSEYIENIQIVPPSRKTAVLLAEQQEKSEPGINIAPSEYETEAYYAKCEAKDDLIVRAAPSPTAEKLGVLPQGTLLKITGKLKDAQWYQIIYASGAGYVKDTYLKEITQVNKDSLYADISKFTLGIGGTKQLQLHLFDRPETVTALQWSSNAPAVAQVNDKGLVTGVSSGSAVITATDEQSGKVFAYTVSVIDFKPSAHIANVPIYNQVEGGYPTGCEQFSMRMLLNYYGYNASTRDVVDALTLSPAPHVRYYKTFGGDPSLSFVGDPKKTKPGGFGCLPSAIANGLNRYLDAVDGKHKAYDITGCDEEIIYQYVSNGTPVLVASGYLPSVGSPVKQPEWTWEIESGPNQGQSVTWWKGRHVMVVVGYDDEYVYINDPWFSKEKRFNKADWLADWERVDRHTVVLLEK